MSKYLDSNGLLYLWQKIKTLVTTAVSGKVDAVSGKGLSTNDYTTDEKNKLAAITASADAVSFSRTLTSGTKIGTITINGTGTDLYCEQNTNTDTQVNVTLATTTKAYLLGTSTAPTATAAAVTTVADTGVYLDTTAGKLTATSFAGSGASLTSLNASKLSTGTVPADRLPAATTTAKGAMSAADKAKLDAFGNASDYALKSDLTSLYKYMGSVATLNDLPTGATTGQVYNVESNGMNYAWDGAAWDALGQLFSIDSIGNDEIDSLIKKAEGET